MRVSAGLATRPSTQYSLMLQLISMICLLTFRDVDKDAILQANKAAIRNNFILWEVSADFDLFNQGSAVKYFEDLAVALQWHFKMS